MELVGRMAKPGENINPVFESDIQTAITFTSDLEQVKEIVMVERTKVSTQKQTERLTKIKFGEILPSNVTEVKTVLNKIQKGNAGGKTKIYNGPEIKQIVTNLGLTPLKGKKNKPDLVDLITEHVSKTETEF